MLFFLEFPRPELCWRLVSAASVRTRRCCLAMPGRAVRAQANHMGGLKSETVIECQRQSVAAISQQLQARQTIGLRPVRDACHQRCPDAGPAQVFAHHHVLDPARARTLCRGHHNLNGSHSDDFSLPFGHRDVGATTPDGAQKQAQAAGVSSGPDLEVSLDGEELTDKLDQRRQIGDACRPNCDFLCFWCKRGVGGTEHAGFTDGGRVSRWRGRSDG